MNQRIKPSDVKNFAKICNEANKKLSFDNPIIESKVLLSNPSGRMKMLLEFSNIEDQKVLEDISMDKKSEYVHIMSLKESKAKDALDVLVSEGLDEAFDYLRGFGRVIMNESFSIGSSDKTFEREGYVMVYNQAMGKIGLLKKRK